MAFTLPTFKTQRLALRVKSAAERKLRQGHPWIFDQAITKQNKEGQAGDIAIIFDQQKNKFLALGLYDPYSPIRVKILGVGQPLQLDADWLRDKLVEAFTKRTPLLATDTDSYRFVYGENDGLPGLVVDVYAGVVVLKLYSLSWIPYLRLLVPLLLELSKGQTLVLRLSRNVQAHTAALHGLYDGQVLVGELVDPVVIFREHGLRFAAHVIDGHKTGYFLDHRHNRRRVGELAKGKRVLDVFAYAGGFSVHALAGGAREVTALDISAQALEMARFNAGLNGAAECLETLTADAFAGLQQLHEAGRQFDLVIIDPPSFAKRASERDRALQSYGRLARLAIPLIAKGGTLVAASCSSRVSAEDFFTTITTQLKNSGRPFQERTRTYHDVDHPIGFPEGAYLKCVFVQL
jgi:23S rRNA (cytosine1962-C5)-methyltransferase